MKLLTWLAGRRRANPGRPAPPAHDHLPGWETRPRSDWETTLTSYIADTWDDLSAAGTVSRGHAIADIGWRQSTAPGRDLARTLFRTAWVLESICGQVGDPDGHFAAVIDELGVACYDLTALDHADGVRP